MLSRFYLLMFLISFPTLGVGMEHLNKKMVKEISSCPETPNCVSSLTSSKKHFMEPWSFNGDVNAVKSILNKKIMSISGVELESEGSDFAHFIFTSYFLKFKDDLWLLFDDKKKVIHFKSASRKGHNDFGVNKKRILKIKKMVF